MPDENKTEVRHYKVILLDKTTSARINNYICNLTGISKWEAAALMNNVPSSIIEGLSLHEAIEIKSQIEHLGTRTKVESYIVGQSEAPDDISAEKPPPEEAPPIEVQEHEEPVSIKEPHIDPAVKKAGHVLRKEKKHHKKILIYTAVTAILIIIVVLFLCVPFDEYLERDQNKHIAHYQDPNRLPKKLKFMKSKKDEIKDLAKVPIDTAAAINLKPDKAPVTSIHGSKQSPLSGFTDALGGKSDAKRSSPKMKEPEVSSTGEDGTAAESAEQETPQNISADRERREPTGSSPERMPGESSGIEMPAFTPAGNAVTPQIIDRLIQDAQDADAKHDPALAAETVRKIEIANMVIKSGQGKGLENYQKPELHKLLKELKPFADSYEMSQGVDFYPEMTGIRVRVHTNVLDGALMKLIIEIPGQEEPVEHIVPVENNMITLPDAGAFPSGTLTIKIVMMPIIEQPPDVKKILGDKGEMLSGPFVQKPGKVEFEDAVINPRARTRGDVLPEDAESELRRLATDSGIGNPETTDLANYEIGELSFITIAANHVVEHEFITKASRSAGMLTTEMDDPPYFLRLIANGRQYFIPTFICRRLLRDFKKDDPAGYDYLVNHLIMF